MFFICWVLVSFEKSSQCRSCGLCTVWHINFSIKNFLKFDLSHTFFGGRCLAHSINRFTKYANKNTEFFFSQSQVFMNSLWAVVKFSHIDCWVGDREWIIMLFSHSQTNIGRYWYAIWQTAFNDMWTSIFLFIVLHLS